MGLEQTINNSDLWGRQVAYRPAAPIAATPTILFSLSGGPVKVTAISVHYVTAVTTAVRWLLTFCGVVMQTAILAAIANIGETMVFPLQTGAAIIAPAAAAPVPTILAAAANFFGVVVSPGAAAGNNLVLTYDTALMDGNTAWSVEYYRLSPMSQIIPR